MEAKIRSYIEHLFAQAPSTLEVHDAREELIINAQERYRDLLTRGFDEQSAYDLTIDSIGDIRELLEELSAPSYRTEPQAEPQESQEPQGNGQHSSDWRYQSSSYEHASYRRAADPWKEFGENLGYLFRNVGKAVNDATSEALRSENWDLGNLFGGLELANRVVVPLDGFGTIDISYMSAQLELCHSKDGTLVVEEYMNSNDPAAYCRLDQNGGVLYIKNGRSFGMLMRAKVKIYIPRDFAGSIHVATQSGSIRSDKKWKLIHFSARSVSGGITLEHVRAQQVQLRTTSGSIFVDELDGTAQVHSVSGFVKCEDVSGCGEFKTTSGGIRVEFKEIFGPVEATSISGGIRIEVPGREGLELKLSSVSGGIHTDFDDQLQYERRQRANGLIGKPPYYPLTVRTTSGGIHIND